MLKQIGEKSRKYNQRLTFHPGQYNCIGSPTQSVIESTTTDLKYHADVLDLMELGEDSVMVIHGGGTYKNKPENYREMV